jgi:hypothetical protein
LEETCFQPDLQAFDDPNYLVKISSADILKAKHETNLELWSRFKQRFREEYLLALRERHHHQKESSYPVWAPSVNDVVLIRDESNPMMWQTGIIVELIRSADHEIRTALVKIGKKNFLRRATVHLYPLEMRSEAASVPNERNNGYLSRADPRNTSHLTLTQSQPLPSTSTIQQPTYIPIAQSRPKRVIKQPARFLDQEEIVNID